MIQNLIHCVYSYNYANEYFKIYKYEYIDVKMYFLYARMIVCSVCDVGVTASRTGAASIRVGKKMLSFMYSIIFCVVYGDNCNGMQNANKMRFFNVQ